MRLAAIQPSFIPWRGYFDFIASVDVFVFLDDVQYTARDWRNRNRIKTPQGADWLSVPVQRRERSQLIKDTLIDYSSNWPRKHLGSWSANYGAAPYFDDISAILDKLGGDDDKTISQLDVRLVRRLCDYLEITTPMVLSSEFHVEDTKTNRLVELVRRLGCTVYLSGPSADAYLDKDLFRENGLQLEYKSYDYPHYPQLWGDFIGEVTVLDLIANCGPGAKKLIRSRTADRIVVPK